MSEIKLAGKLTSGTTSKVLADAYQISGGHSTVQTKSELSKYTDALKIHGMEVYVANDGDNTGLYRWNNLTKAWDRVYYGTSLKGELEGNLTSSNGYSYNTNYRYTNGVLAGSLNPDGVQLSQTNDSGLGNAVSSLRMGYLEHYDETNKTSTGAGEYTRYYQSRIVLGLFDSSKDQIVDYSLVYPNKSGTVALLEDITAGNVEVMKVSGISPRITLEDTVESGTMSLSPNGISSSITDWTGGHFHCNSDSGLQISSSYSAEGAVYVGGRYLSIDYEGVTYTYDASTRKTITWDQLYALVQGG